GDLGQRLARTFGNAARIIIGLWRNRRTLVEKFGETRGQLVAMVVVFERIGTEGFVALNGGERVRCLFEDRRQAEFAQPRTAGLRRARGYLYSTAHCRARLVPRMGARERDARWQRCVRRNAQIATGDRRGRKGRVRDGGCKQAGGVERPRETLDADGRQQP